jgi:hypothetical protein
MYDNIERHTDSYNSTANTEFMGLLKIQNSWISGSALKCCRSFIKMLSSGVRSEEEEREGGPWTSEKQIEKKNEERNGENTGRGRKKTK